MPPRLRWSQHAVLSRSELRRPVRWRFDLSFLLIEARRSSSSSSETEVKDGSNEESIEPAKLSKRERRKLGLHRLKTEKALSKPSATPELFLGQHFIAYASSYVRQKYQQIIK